MAPGEAAVLRDPVLGITAEGLRLKRQVQMYQWKERSETRSSSSGRTTTSTTVYFYDQDWAPDRIESNAFHRGGHANPPLLLNSENVYAPRVLLGAYELSPWFVWLLEPGAGVRLDASMLERRSPDLQAPVHLQDASTLFVGQDPNSPKLGDLRISYRVVPLTSMVTVVGKQVGNRIEKYEDPDTGKRIALVMPGEQPLEAFFTRLQESNQEDAWPMRLVCGVFVFIFLLPFAFLLPSFTGPLSHGQMVCACVLLCVPGSVLPMGLAWLGVKPLTGMGLMGSGGLGMYGVLRLMRWWARA